MVYTRCRITVLYTGHSAKPKTISASLFHYTPVTGPSSDRATNLFLIFYTPTALPFPFLIDLEKYQSDSYVQEIPIGKITMGSRFCLCVCMCFPLSSETWALCMTVKCNIGRYSALLWLIF